LQRRTLGAMLGRALDHQAWDDATAIVRALDAYWGARGLGGEAAAWADRILAATTGPGQRPLAAAESLWLHVITRQATRRNDAGRPDQAAQAYRQALAWLLDQPATDWARRNTSVLYHQLGMTAQARGQLEEADDWYRQSLAISEELGNRPYMANGFHQLGMTAQARGRLEEAGDWYHRSLAIEVELGNRPGMASSYHQLGVTARDREQWEEAEDWFRQSLAIKVELGNRPGMASTFHQLGSIAYACGRWEEAEDWYRQSLAITEELGSRPYMAATYAELGMLAEAQNQAAQALGWNVRCVALFSEFPSPQTGTGPSALARLTRQLGMPTLDAAWQQATGQPLPPQIRHYITSQQHNKEGAQP
jgi:tetratricopeptide (TPR) repeat protein